MYGSTATLRHVRPANPKSFSYLDSPTPLAFAHRGGETGHPENTLPAFAGAVELGFRYLETDAHLTADGHVVAFHDDVLDRVTTLTGPIERRSAAELQQPVVDALHPVPLMSDLLDAFPDARINIDPKSDAVLEPLIDLLRRHDALDRVALGAFSDSRLERARQLAGPSLCTALGPRAVAGLIAASRTRRLWPRPPEYAGAMAQVPVQQGRIPIVTPAFVELAHRAGLQVHVWTIDDPDEMTRLLDLGVDGIMTDRPAVLRDVLTRRGAWPT